MGEEDSSRTGPEVPRFYTLEEVATILRVDVATCRRWVKSGLFDIVVLSQTGKRTIFRISQRVLDELLVEQRFIDHDETIAEK